MNQNKSFLDRGTLIALVVVMGFWIFWSRYMETKYPQQNAGTAQEVVQGNDPKPEPAKEGEKTSQQAAVTPGATMGAAQPSAPNAPAQETQVDYSDDKLSFTITSVGMGLKKITVKDYTTRDKQPIVLSKLDETSSFATTTVTGVPINFAIERVGQN
jgi:YidC/Oxa1 family membrane protein insertase